MASKCCGFVGRRAASTIKSALRSTHAPSSSPKVSGFSPSATPSQKKANTSPLRGFCLSRTPSELGCVQSLLPLHSAVSASRMTSCLSVNSRSCRSLSQGTLCCTSPSL